MLEIIAIFAMLQSVQVQTAEIDCDFPGGEDGARSVRVLLDPMPSLKDQPGLYRVRMELEGMLTLKAAAQPIQSTDDRDILISAKSPTSAVVLLGMRDDGAAALTVRDSATKSTRLGACKGIEHHINRWLPS